MSVVDELRAWASEAWSPDRTLRSWWAAMARAGWAAPAWPEGQGGRGLPAATDAVVRRTLRGDGMIPPPDGLGQMMGGPVLLDHGTDDQRTRHLVRLAAGLETWCQLFSEPAAGSDLAGVRTAAVRDGDRWVVSGQKVWTSGAHLADRGLLLARTDPEAPKHQGMTYFVIDMDQPGIEVRPLREMSGNAFFSEVFLDEAVVEDAERIGAPGDGWRVALSTLMHERTGLAQRGGVGPQSDPIRPGRRAGLLDLTCAEVLERVAAHGTPTSQGVAHWRTPDRLDALAADRGRAADPRVRQALARHRAAHLAVEITRQRARHTGSTRLGPLGKLGASSLARPARDLAASLLGADGMLVEADGTTDPADETVSAVARMVLHSPAASIAGGTDEVQRNIIGERVLGLPPEPRVDRDVPFRELPQ